MSGENRVGKPPEVGPDEEIGLQPGTSRRSLLRGAAGLAGAGLAAGAVTGALTGSAMASVRPGEPARHPAEGAETGGAAGVIVHVRDARSGEMDIFSGTSQVRVRDPHLARQLVQAVR